MVSEISSWPSSLLQPLSHKPKVLCGIAYIPNMPISIMQSETGEPATGWVYRPSGLKPDLNQVTVYFLVLIGPLLNRGLIVRLQFSRSLSSLIQCQIVLKCWDIPLSLVHRHLSKWLQVHFQEDWGNHYHVYLYDIAGSFLLGIWPPLGSISLSLKTNPGLENGQEIFDLLLG